MQTNTQKLFASVGCHRVEVSILSLRIYRITKAEKVVNRGKSYCQDVYLFNLMTMIRLNTAPEMNVYFHYCNLCFVLNQAFTVFYYMHPYNLVSYAEKKNLWLDTFIRLRPNLGWKMNPILHKSLPVISQFNLNAKHANCSKRTAFEQLYWYVVPDLKDCTTGWNHWLLLPWWI